MRYCLFEDGDVLGPFEAEQLLLRPGFGPDRLVCPEEHSDDESFWKEAFHYPELMARPSAQPPASVPAAEAAREAVLAALQTPPAPDGAEEEEIQTEPEDPLMSELKSAVAEFSTLSVPEDEPALFSTSQEPVLPGVGGISAREAAPEPVALQTPSAPDEAEEEEPPTEPASPAKVSPIEEYFNTIKSGDLGNILGIPDPKENSDLNLSRVLESQFEKTDPQISSPEEPDPFDAFTAPAPAALPAPAEETPAEAPTQQTASDSAAALKRETQNAQKQTLPAVQEETETVPPETQEPQADNTAAAPEQKPQEQAEPQEEKDPVISTILEGKLEKDAEDATEITEPVHSVPRSVPIAVPAVDKDLETALAARLPSAPKRRHAGLKWLGLVTGAAVLAFAFWLNLRQEEKPQPPAPAAETKTSEETAQPAAPVALSVPTPAAPAAPKPADLVTLAKQTVQQYPLSGGRGTVQEYLSARYASELASGYSAAWLAEPLHKDVYVVKYRLTKTRKEPVVYIFQVNTAKKKLTGALNNITLDLVGKIN